MKIEFEDVNGKWFIPEGTIRSVKVLTDSARLEAHDGEIFITEGKFDG